MAKKIQVTRNECAHCFASDADNTNSLKKCSKCLLVFYCSKECQKSHWVSGGHRKVCIAPKVRTSLSEGDRTDLDPVRHSDVTLTMCLICLSEIRTCPFKLPCKHTFHAECIEQLQEYPHLNSCPTCRSTLPNRGSIRYALAMNQYFEMDTAFFQRTGKHFIHNDKITYEQLSQSEFTLMSKFLFLLEQAANMGDSKVQYLLARAYDQGILTAVNDERAAYWHEKAALSGHAISQRLLGKIMFRGDLPTGRNMSEAAKWFALAAKNGCHDSQYILGNMHRIGDGVPVDKKEAFRLLTLSVEQGNKKAMHLLGLLYYEGEVVCRSLNRAALLFKVAANEGCVRALLLLGECYLRGHGVPQNVHEADRCFKVANEHEHKEEVSRALEWVRDIFVEEDNKRRH